MADRVERQPPAFTRGGIAQQSGRVSVRDFVKDNRDHKARNQNGDKGESFSHWFLCRHAQAQT